jgi:hypothetical protein
MLFYILIFTSYDLTSVVVKHPNVLANGNWFKAECFHIYYYFHDNYKNVF